MRCSLAAVVLLTASLSASLLRADAARDTPGGEPRGLGDPGQLVSLTIETGRTVDGSFRLAGRDAGQQLQVDGHYESRQVRDLTRSVQWDVRPPDIVHVDDNGYVRPLAEGKATIQTRNAKGYDATIDVQVTNIAQDLPVSFPNEIVPIFTKYGCNSGGCHGKSGGQNGFRLSLLGFEPDEDYEYLVKEGKGRRLFPAAPARSLLLRKATAQLAHGGGPRIDIDSPSYRLLQRWIEQGMPFGHANDPQVARIEVVPATRRMGQEQSQQLSAVAFYTDGSTRDVTRMTQFESNDTEMAEVDETGHVSTGSLAGNMAIMARFQGHVSLFRATIPLGVPVEPAAASKNFIDNLVFAKLQDLGLPPSPPANDATFLRRVTIDIGGRLPTQDEAERFLQQPSADKRQQVVERLLASTDYADYFANKWSSVLRNKRRSDGDRLATYAFHNWIRASLHDNKPYDEFVAEILTASGSVESHPPVAWYREVRDASAQVEDTAQLFLGMRIQCARCHHHPFEKWSQEDYFGFQAFFSRVARKRGPRNQDRIYHRAGVAQSQHPKTKQTVKPAGLGAPPLDIDPLDDPRHALVDWLTAEDNPFFAKALVNRYWKHFFGRGLVDPEDDMRLTNPASHPELLDALAEDFVRSGFDLKHLVRTICNSQVYQLSSEPNSWNRDDKQNFSRFYPKRLNAEVLLDAINQVTGTVTDFGAIPSGTRAVQLPDNGFNSYFLTVFGRPDSNSACECERTCEANLAQTLHLLNSKEVLGKLTSGSGRAAALAVDKQRDQREKIRDLYLLAFAREPKPREIAVATAYLERNEDPRRAYEDLVWVLVNTKEFLFNH